MKKVKQILSIILALMMLVCAVPVMEAEAITESDFNSRLSTLRSQYPNYSTWTAYYDGGHQCWGFARLIADSVFGGSWKNWPQVNSISNVKAGDIVQYGNTSGSGHTIFVQSVSGNTITFVDCNGNGNYSGGTKVRSCGIKWDNTISKSASMFGKYNFSYLLSSPRFDNPNPNMPRIEYTYLDYTLSDRTSFRPNCVVDPSVVAIDHVSLAVWSVGSQSDLRWYDCSVGGPHGTIYYYDVPHSNHDSGAKSFVCDFYVYGTNGKITTDRIVYDVDEISPTISNISFKHVSGGYIVTCNVSDNIGVSSVGFATWTPKNGQDDLLWQWVTPSGNSVSCTIKKSDHNNEDGQYITHVYAYDNMGNSSNQSAPDIFLGNYAFDVNGYLDGSNSGSLGSYGTFDLYFDGKLYLNDITDWANLISCGTAFEIKDIKATTGHTYNGVKSGVIKGTMNGSNTIYLNFTTNSSTLKVDPYGGTWNSSASVQTFKQNYNTTKAIPVPTRSGYTFTGWTRSGTNGKLSSTTAAATYTFGATNNVTDMITATWSCNHNTIKIENAKAADCLNAGYTGDTVCVSCGKTLSTGSIISALEHTAPDAAGNCTRCGVHIKDVEEPIDPTNPTDPINPTNPTQPTNPAPQPQPQQSGSCRYCGGTHTGFPGVLIGFFHSILALFGLRK